MVKTFSKISGDTNPIHIDKEYAQKSIFKQRISHGMLPMCFIQKYFDDRQLKIKNMEIKFMKPIFLDEEILIEVNERKEGEDNKFKAEIKKIEKSQ